MKFQHLLVVIAIATSVSCNNNSSASEKAGNATAQAAPATNAQKPINMTAPAVTLNPTDNYAKAADETCQCLQPLISKVKQMVELQKAGKAAEIAVLANEIRAIEPKITACSENIRKKYGDMKTEEDKKRIFYALKDRCPDAVSIGEGLK